jgi:uncharacterized RDD family membrane protein YckC
MTTPERAIAFIVAGVIALFLSWFLPQSKSPIYGWAASTLGIVGFIVETVGALVLGGSVVNLIVSAINPHPGILVEILARSVAVLVPLYLTVLSTQLIANIVRLIRGQRPNQIEWIKGYKRNR